MNPIVEMYQASNNYIISNTIVMLTGSPYILNKKEITNKEGKNISTVLFSIFYNPRNKTGKLKGSNTRGEFLSRALSGTEYSFLSEPSYFKINIALASESPVLFNIHFCILKDGKCDPNPDQSLIISILSGVGSFICLAFFVLSAYFGFLKKRRNLKRNPTNMEINETNTGKLYFKILEFFNF